MRFREEVEAQEIAGPVDPKRFIGRVEAARQMGMTVGGIRYYEPSWFVGAKVRSEVGIIYYERKVFEAFHDSRSGSASAADCFRLFLQGLSPHEVVQKLNHPRPMLVRRLYEEHLSLISLGNCVVIQFDPNLDMHAWKGACALPQDEPIHGAYVRRALELVAFDPDYRERCRYAVRQYEEEQKRARAQARLLKRATQTQRAPRRGRPKKRATDPSRSRSTPPTGPKTT